LLKHLKKAKFFIEHDADSSPDVRKSDEFDLAIDEDPLERKDSVIDGFDPKEVEIEK
jgi:hypothetical protein